MARINLLCLPLTILPLPCLPPLPPRTLTGESFGLLHTQRLGCIDTSCSSGWGNYILARMQLQGQVWRELWMTGALCSQPSLLVGGLPGIVLQTLYPPALSSTVGAAVASAAPAWPSSRGQRWSSIRLLWNLLSRSKKPSSSEDGALGIPWVGRETPIQPSVPQPLRPSPGLPTLTTYIPKT